MKKKDTISEKIYFELYSKIMNLNIKPGKIISIKDICDSMKVSRSPARDAIIRLEDDGLVESIPQVGIRITQIDFNKMENERYLRHCIEYKMAIDYTSKGLTAKDIIKFENTIKLQRMAIQEKDFVSFLNYDDEFHKVLFNIHDRDFIWKVIMENQAHYRRMRLLAIISMGQEHLNKLVDKHLEMVECIKNKETEKFIKMLESHVSELVEEKFWLKDNYPDLIYSENEEGKKDNVLENDDFYNDLIENK